jgi:hypothetical protein
LGDWKLIHYYEDGHEELYNLKKDISETTDLATREPSKVKQLHEKLFSYLNEVGARFPKPDPQYDALKEKEYLRKVETELLPKLEKQRLSFLSEYFDPGNNWWGSEVKQLKQLENE